MTTTCVIDYRVEKNGIHSCRVAGENTHVNFNYHVAQIKWGGVILVDKPEVYERFHRASDEDKHILINNRTMGFDPQVGTTKRAEFTIVRVDKDREWDEHGFGQLWENEKFPADSGGHGEEVPEIHYHGKR